MAQGKNRTGKRGVLLTLTLVLLAITLLAFSGLLVKQRQNEVQTIRGSFDRVINLEASIQKSITDLIKEHLPLIIVINGSNVTITEDLPADITGLEAEFADFENFVESNFDFVKINANIGDILLNLTPAGIIYSHTNGAEKVLIENVNRAKSYEITITFPPSASWACQINWEEYRNGTTRVKVIAVDNQTSCQSEKTIDPLENNDITIPHSQGDAKIKIDDNEIEIFRNNNNPYTSSVTIEPLPNSGITEIELSDITTNVSFISLDIVSKARFLTY